MSAAISEGLPLGDTTRVFEPPQINQDNARPRYLTCLGSFITPEVASQRPWTRGGGIEIANPCLRYVRNFLRRGRITPLLRDTHDFLPYDYVRKTLDVDPLSAGYFAQQIPPGYIPPHLPPPNGQGMLSGPSALGGYSPYGSMVGKLALPGAQLDSILNGDDNVNRSNGNRKGIVEFTALVGHEYRPQDIGLDNGATVNFDPELWAMQRAIFPTYPDLPVKLDDLARLLDAATIHLSLTAIIDTYRESLSQFRDYVDSYIQNVHQQQRERGPNGYVRPYTAGDLVLLDQLGMERQDRQALPSKDRLEDALEQLIALQIEEKQANIARLGRLESIGQVDPPAPSKEVKFYTCEHCGEEVKELVKDYTSGCIAGRYIQKGREVKTAVTTIEEVIQRSDLLTAARWINRLGDLRLRVLETEDRLMSEDEALAILLAEEDMCQPSMK